MPNRLTNFDWYQPLFTRSNSTSQMYFDLKGVQVPSSRLSITEDGIAVSGVTQNKFESIETMKYNARLNNPARSYADVTVSYIGESFDATTAYYKLEMNGFTLKENQGNTMGTFSDAVNK